MPSNVPRLLAVAPSQSQTWLAHFATSPQRPCLRNGDGASFDTAWQGLHHRDRDLTSDSQRMFYGNDVFLLLMHSSRRRSTWRLGDARGCLGAGNLGRKSPGDDCPSRTLPETPQAPRHRHPSRPAPVVLKVLRMISRPFLSAAGDQGRRALVQGNPRYQVQYSEYVLSWPISYICEAASK